MLSFQFVSMRDRYGVEYEFSQWKALVDGTADTPFQYRVLIPWLYRAGVHLKLLNPATVPPRTMFLGSDFVSLFLLFWVFRRYLLFFFRDLGLASVLAFSIFLTLPFNLILRYPPWFYPWDIPSMLFFTLGLILLYQRTWWLYYVVFAVGTLNRETTCFLICIYVLTAVGRDDSLVIALHSVAQMFLWLGIKCVLLLMYRYNSGDGLFEAHLFPNLALLSNLSYYPLMLSWMGFIWIPVLIYFRRIPDFFVRRSVLVVVPFFLGMLLVGNLHEVRIFAELSPVLLAAFWLIVRDLFLGEIAREEVLATPSPVEPALPDAQSRNA